MNSRTRTDALWSSTLLFILVVVGTLGLGVPRASAAVSALRLTAGMSAQPVPAGGIFLEADLVVDQPGAGGSTVLTGSADGTTGLLVDDAVEVSVRHEDGSAENRLVRFNPVCAVGNEPLNVDLSSLLKAGKNHVHLAFKDHCGGSVSTSAAFIRGDAKYELTNVAKPGSVKVADAVEPRPASPGDVFLKEQFTAEMPAVAGWGVLTGSPDGLTPLLIDDMLTVRVTHPDGTTVTRENRFNPVCAAANEGTNIDLTTLLAPGTNTITLIASDVCGGGASSTPIYFRGPGTTGGPILNPENCPDPANGIPPLDPVSCYAPEVHLHPEETTFPDSPRDFIAKSKLMWATDGTCSDRRVGKGKVNPRLLGSGGYRQAEVTLTCKDKGRKYASNKLTRPFDEGKSRPKALAKKEGFYLNFPNDRQSRAGDKVQNNKVSSPLFYELGCAASTPTCSISSGPGSIQYITYWFFYDYNSNEVDKHEGDWEHLRVWLTSAGVIKRVSYGQHGCPDETYPAYGGGTPVTYFADTHPKVFSAKGGHASYPAPRSGHVGACGLIEGRYDDAKDGGAVWQTWDHLADDMSTEPWYMFGGAWGKVGKVYWTTGPLSPGWKSRP